jgi:hypothetical protein
VDSLKNRPIYPRGKNAGTHSTADWVLSRPNLKVLEKSKIFVLARIRTLDCPAYNLIHIQTTHCLQKCDQTQHIIFLAYTYSKFCSFSESKNFRAVIYCLKVLQSHFDLQNYQILLPRNIFYKI